MRYCATNNTSISHAPACLRSVFVLTIFEVAVLMLQVPITLYFMTHAYFCFYHALSNVVLRRTMYAVQQSPRICQWLSLATVVFVLAYITALMETVTIAHFPYYRFKVGMSQGAPCMNVFVTSSSASLHTHLQSVAVATDAGPSRCHAL